MTRPVDCPADGVDPGFEQCAEVREALIPQQIKLVHGDDVGRQAFNIGPLGMVRPGERVGGVCARGVVRDVRWAMNQQGDVVVVDAFDYLMM